MSLEDMDVDVSIDYDAALMGRVVLKDEIRESAERIKNGRERGSDVSYWVGRSQSLTRLYFALKKGALDCFL